MLVSKYPNWVAVVQWKDGHVHFFDGAKDMFKFLQDLPKYAPGHRPGDIEAILVTDFYNLRRIDARKALFVLGSDVLGPMGHELVPQADRLDAEEFLKGHKGKRIVDFGQVTPDVWNQASQLSRPDMFSYAPEPASLVPVFRAIAAPRTSGPSTSAPPGPGRSAARASYPRAATQATNQPPQTGPQRGPQARHGGPYMPGRGSGTGQGR